MSDALLHLIRTHLCTRWAARLLAIPAIAAMGSSLVVSGPGAVAKTPGKTYCFHGVCHRVLTLAQTRHRVGRRHSVTASFYRHCKVDRYNPCGLTSSGAVFRPSRADNAASPIYPNGTKLLVWNPSNKRAAVVRIDNAGPYWGNRTLDLSSAAASKLGFRHRGVARLTVQVLSAPTRRQARYRRHRVYPRVAGYIGRHRSLASAVSAAGGSRSRGRVRIASARELKRQKAAEIRLAKRAKAKRTRAQTRRLAANKVTLPVKKTPKVARRVRLPARLVRAERPLRRLETRARRRRVASLQRTRAAKAKQAIRQSTRVKPKPQSRQVVVRQAKANVPKRVVRSTRRQLPVTRTAAPRRAIPAPTAVKAPAVVKRPRLVWRRSILGVNTGGS